MLTEIVDVRFGMNRVYAMERDDDLPYETGENFFRAILGTYASVGIKLTFR